DGTAKIVAVETGEEIARIDHDSGVLAVAWSLDGKQVATASNDGTAKVSTIQITVLRAKLCTERLSRNLTAQEWERYLDLNLTTYGRTCDNLPAHPSVTSRALELAGSNPDQALTILQHLIQIDPDADLDPATPDTQETEPQVAINNELARRKRRDGLQAVENKDIETATERFTEALKLNPKIDLNPDTKEIEQDIEAVIKAIQNQSN
ncbi:MAG: hypothetical protein AAGG51_28615, partial [Cyanobacteria bacterium P01_G01_bin.54]